MSDVGRIGLGTVQFGLPYGRFNKEGLPDKESVSATLAAAWEAGIRTLDTAAQYGESESRLGELANPDFRIVTKTPPLRGQESPSVSLIRGFHESLSRLNRKSVHGLLAHNADDLLGPFGREIFSAMADLRESGKVSRIGASVYTAEQIEKILVRFSIDLIQAPVNILDRRLTTSGWMKRLKEAGIEVHARSVFLQGLLLSDPSVLPCFFDSARPAIMKLRERARLIGITPLTAALRYVLDLPEVDVALVGVDNAAQLREILDDAACRQRVDASDLGVDDVEILNPGMWAKE
jgi:aryl-alcohol dehydrogenase-like predicted oxidoreductase